jgi:hypothetical protein
MNTQELITRMQEVFETLTTENSSKFKTGKGRARKAASELKKLAGEYKKASLEESKIII